MKKRKMVKFKLKWMSKKKRKKKGLNFNEKKGKKKGNEWNFNRNDFNRKARKIPSQKLPCRQGLVESINCFSAEG